MDADIKLNGDTVTIEGTGGVTIGGPVRIPSSSLTVPQATIGILAAPKGAEDVICRARGVRIFNPSAGATDEKTGPAISHAKSDTLMLNEGKGYAGGVEVDGNLNVDSVLTAAEAKIGIIGAFKGAEDVICRARGIRIFNPSAGATDEKIGPAISHAKNDTLAVNEGEGYAGGVRIHGTLFVDEIIIAGVPGPGIISSDFDLIEHFITLAGKVAVLEDKVAKLEKKK